MKYLFIILLLIISNTALAKDNYYIYKDADGNLCTCINTPSCGCPGILQSTVKIIKNFTNENTIIYRSQIINSNLEKSELKVIDKLGLKNIKKYVIKNKVILLIIYVSDINKIDEKILKYILKNNKLKFIK